MFVAPFLFSVMLCSYLLFSVLFCCEISCAQNVKRNTPTIRRSFCAFIAKGRM